MILIRLLIIILIRIKVEIKLILNKDFSITKDSRLNLLLNFDEFCHFIKKELNISKIKTMRLFNANGIEIFEDDIKFIKNKQEIYISKGINNFYFTTSHK